jgi:pyruvate formate lyase activating enzyme
MMQMLDALDRMTKPGILFESLEDGVVRCTACAHRCLLRPGKRGICQIRFNQDGVLRVPWGYVAGLQADPIEKKPFAHFLPGSSALTFGMLGCNFHCDFCQNWLSSQVGHDPEASSSIGGARRISPESIVEIALQTDSKVIASSYNEPVITSEWAFDVFKLAVQKDIRCVMVSNGYATLETLNYLKPVLSGYKIDLKTMQDRAYRGLGGVLQNVLDTIKQAHDLGIWVEVVTLVIPGFNDSPGELWDAAKYINSVSPDIPWHVTGFHPDYHHYEADPTTAASLQQAADIGQEAGLHFVYAGNLPGRVGSLEDTFCPVCNTRLIQRRGYLVQEVKITAEGKCPHCGAAIAGVWK